MAYPFDVGSQIAVIHGFDYESSSVTSITTGSTASMGDPIDLSALAGNYKSCKSIVALGARVVSTSGKGYYTIGLRMETADSSNSTAFDATHTTETTIVIGSTADGVAANDFDVFYQDVDLSGAEKWVRQVVTITKVATSSADWITVKGLLALGGAAILPATS